MNTTQPTWETVLLQEWVSGVTTGVAVILVIIGLFYVWQTHKSRKLGEALRDTVGTATKHMTTEQLLQWLTSGSPDYITDGHRVEYHDTTDDGCHAHCLCGELSDTYPGTKGDNVSKLETWAAQHVEESV